MAVPWKIIDRFKKSLHPSRRMAWKKIQHGVAEKFSSPRKKIRHSSPNPLVLIIFYKISKNISILFCYNKIKLYLCPEFQTTKQPLAVSHWPLAKQQTHTTVILTIPYTEKDKRYFRRAKAKTRCRNCPRRRRRNGLMPDAELN